MDWPTLKRDPIPGDVLWHNNGLMVLVLRRHEFNFSSSVDVMWIYNTTWESGEVTTHDGGLRTWRDWRTP